MCRLPAAILLQRTSGAKHLFFIALFLVLVLGAPTRSFGQSCGGADQRACCVGEASFGACQSGLTVVSGCPPTLGDANFSGGCGCSNISANAITACVNYEPCGAAGERACCNGSGEFSNNGLACNAGLVQISGCDESNGINCFCGDGLFKSAGTCVEPKACGGAGQRACCVGTLEFSNNGGTCDTGLTAVNGCAGDCTCGGTTAIGEASTQSCTVIEPISEPDVDAAPASGTPSGPTDPECPTTGLCGYADLHVHMFAHLAHGGATIAGTPYDPTCTPGGSCGGVNTALGEDYGISKPVVNGSGTLLNLVDGSAGAGKPQCPDYLINSPLGNLCSGQYLFHGDHTPIDTTTYGGTNDATASNFGAPSFNGWPQWTSTIHQQVYYKWLQRAWLGGLRLMVMDAVTNETLCKTGYRLQDFDGTDPTDCTNSMMSIDAQLNAAWDFQTWLDNQYGGPGLGWFRIVTTPQQATQVIQAGNLAVVLGIEVDNLFNCHFGADTGTPYEPVVYPFEQTGTPTTMNTCTAAYVQQQVQNYYNMGVRHIFPIHNFDNAYGSPAAWQDSINVGNAVGEGRFWDDRNCVSENYGFWLSVADELLEGELLEASGFNLPGLPQYTASTSSSPWATCNARGLSSLGETLINALMDNQMIIDIDHMSEYSLGNTLGIAANRKYPGIVATHVQFFDLYQQDYTGNFGRHERMRTKAQLQQIASLGGMVAAMLKDDVQDTGIGYCLPNAVCFAGFPTAGPLGGDYTVPQGTINNNCRYSTTEWAQAYLYGAQTMGGPVAMGSDFNGVAGHVGPRFGSAACGGDSTGRSAQEKAATLGPLPFPPPPGFPFIGLPGYRPRLAYPFTIPGFGTFSQQVSGQRTFDYNTDGLAHIGLLPDMVADLLDVGLNYYQLQPLFGSAQAYINMWAALPSAPPTQLAVSAPASVNPGSAFTFTVTAQNSSGVTVPGYTGTVQFSSSDVSSSLPANYTFVPASDNGVHTFTATLNTGGSQTITAMDTANSLTGTSNGIVVNQAPAITSGNSTTFTVPSLGVFLVTATGFPAPTFTETGALPSGVFFTPGGVLRGSPGTGTGGTYNITITASNGVSPNATQSFTLIVNEPPAITSGNSTTFTVPSLGVFLVTATGFPAPTFTETGALPSGVFFTPGGVLRGNPGTGTGGTYNITITASNGVSPNATQSFALIVNEPPAITSGNSTTFMTGAPGSFNVRATGYPASTFTETGALPSGVTLTPGGVLSGPPASGTGGVYNITITASNGVLPNAMQSFTLTVRQPPAITSANSVTFTTGTFGSFTVTASGYPASTFTTGALPSGLTLTPAGVLSGTPAAGTGGVYNITITASNGVLPNATQSFTLILDQPPAITSAGASGTTFTVGKSGSFTVTATGYPAPTFTETGTLPGGVTLTPGGVLSGTAAAGTGGVYPITITASNGVSPIATQSYTLTVFNPASTLNGSNCNGYYIGTYNGNLTVSNGQMCIFSLGGVTGNVTQNGGTLLLENNSFVDGNLQVNGGGLSISNSTVGNHLQITGATTFSIGPSVSINGNLQIQNVRAGTAQDRVCGTTVKGDLQFQNNAAPVVIGAAAPASCPGNQIGGNLTIQGNTATAWTQVFNNMVTRNLQCERNASITGGRNTAKQKLGQCATF
jgi:microsomal dipeptidase-like Zn-dependent dipeptidase